jgi:hypothetical protein
MPRVRTPWGDKLERGENAAGMKYASGMKQIPPRTATMSVKGGTIMVCHNTTPHLNPLTVFKFNTMHTTSPQII